MRTSDGKKRSCGCGDASRGRSRKRAHLYEVTDAHIDIYVIKRRQENTRQDKAQWEIGHALVGYRGVAKRLVHSCHTAYPPRDATHLSLDTYGQVNGVVHDRLCLTLYSNRKATTAQ